MQDKPAFKKLQKYYFKMVAKVGGRFLSIYDGETQYSLGQILHEPAQPNHGGGYYVYPTMKQAVFADIPNNKQGLYTAPRTILVCICWGDYVEYSNGKIAFSYLSPVKELPLERGYIATKAARREADELKENNKKRGSVLIDNMKEKLISLAAPKDLAVRDPVVRKQVLENYKGSDLLKNENDMMEKEIKQLEMRLQGIMLTR